MLSKLKTSAQAWWARPYSPDMNVQGWALFLGLMLVLVILWKIVLAYIEDAID
jgi:hypothetical protein